MKREQALAKNTIILTFGKFVPQIINMITLPIITGALTVNEYGTYDLVLTLVSLLLPIATLQIQSAAFRFLINTRENKQESEKIVTNILFFTIPVSLVVLLVAFFCMGDIEVIIKILICAYFMADILFITLEQIARGLSYNKDYAISSIVLSITNVIIIVLTLCLSNKGLKGVLLAAFLSNIISAIYLANRIKLFTYVKGTLISASEIKKLLRYSWPMVPNNLSTWILKISDRLVITWFLGIEANAVYAVANKLPNILNVARGTFIMAWQENASIVSKDEDATAYYSKMFDTIYSMIIGITALLIGFTPVMFKILIRGNYNEAYYQMPILFIGVFFGCISSFQGGIYVAYMKTKSVGITTMFAAACNLILDLLLVNRIGITAGSVSTLVSYLILFLYRMFDVLKIQKIEYNYLKLVLEFIVIIFMSVLCFIRNPILNIINLLIGIIFAFYINRNMVQIFINMFLVKLKRKK